MRPLPSLSIIIMVVIAFAKPFRSTVNHNPIRLHIIQIGRSRNWSVTFSFVAGSVRCIALCRSMDSEWQRRGSIVPTQFALPLNARTKNTHTIDDILHALAVRNVCTFFSLFAALLRRRALQRLHSTRSQLNLSRRETDVPSAEQSSLS